MRKIEVKTIEDAVAAMIGKACTRLSDDCKVCLQTAAERESNVNAKFALDMLLENSAAAEKNSLPVCQDTGMAVFFVSLGQDVHVEGGLLIDAINAGVKRGYANLRASVLDPISRVNTGDNTPAVVHVDLTAGEELKIEFLPKGFGSENMSKLYMLVPSQGIDGVKACIIDAVKQAGANPCPPIVVGVGIGGTSEKAMELAKKQLLRDLNDTNPDDVLSAIEDELKDKINALKIGAQGFGGDTTAYAVKIGKHPTHISALPVAVNIQCNAVRKSVVEL